MRCGAGHVVPGYSNFKTEVVNPFSEMLAWHGRHRCWLYADGPKLGRSVLDIGRPLQGTRAQASQHELQTPLMANFLHHKRQRTDGFSHV